MKKNWSQFVRYLKRFKKLVKLKQSIMGAASRVSEFFDGTHGITHVNIVREYPLFSPSSAGKYKQKAALTSESINTVIPLLSEFSKKYHNELLKVSVEQLTYGSNNSERETQLKLIFNHYGSDKGGDHEYYKIYSHVIEKLGEVSAVLEVGLGTNNTDIVSNMSRSGKPGASLRAFRDIFFGANIYGADVDKRILFQENRIKTFHVDQTDLKTLYTLKSNLPNELNLIIDDGLHAPNANLATLLVLLDKLKVGGFFIIEDIPSAAIPVWEVVAALLPSYFHSKIVKAPKAWVFLVERHEV